MKSPKFQKLIPEERLKDPSKLRPEDLAIPADIQVVQIREEWLMPLPFIKLEEEPRLRPPPEEWKKEMLNLYLDGYANFPVPRPKSKEEEQEIVRKFIEGIKKLFSVPDNWTQIKPLLMVVEYCARCQTCAEVCQIFLSGGKKHEYLRPTFKTEILKMLYDKYVKGKKDVPIEANIYLIARLYELSYRCTVCRRCFQFCPLGLDQGVVARELRKVFSQQLGWAPKELHELGTVQQLRVGSSTGTSPKAMLKMVKWMEEDIKERTGKKIRIPVDEKGADILIIHNYGEFLSWPENPEAFAIIFEEAGLSWTLASIPPGYDAVNYGLYYDDIQLAKIAAAHCEVARKLEVKKIVIGECGHAHRALIQLADRVLPDDLKDIPRESCMPLLAELVEKGKLNLDPEKNNFPVTLHDPCNMVRMMGIVEPQRRILRKICPLFREMNPHGVKNFCCGAGGAFAIMYGYNFPDWKYKVAGRMKVKQTLEAFADCISPDIPKYLCAPCSNCKGMIRDTFAYYDLWGRFRVLYGGLVELIVNAMVDIEKPFIEWMWR